MKSVYVLIVAALVVVGLTSMAVAHEGEKYTAFQFADDSVPTIDGDLSDWSFVPDSYSITMDQLTPSGGDIDDSDISITHTVGFNPIDEFLYFSTIVFDDFHSVDRDDAVAVWEDDDLEIRIDAKHLPASEQNLQGRALYIYAVPPVLGTHEVIVPFDNDYLRDGHVEFGWSFNGEQDGEATYFYEVKLHPVVALGDTEADTEFFGMEAGKVIHFNLTVSDVDVEGSVDPDGPDVENYSVGPGGLLPGVDLILGELDPSVDQTTAVEGVSWGMIKAGLSPQ